MAKSGKEKIINAAFYLFLKKGYQGVSRQDIKAAIYFYQNLPKTNHNFDTYTQIQWLVDTKERLKEYLDLARQLGKVLRLNLEIDVGLHRGGFRTINQLEEALRLIKDNQKHLSFSGLMGYDPHVTKLPKLLRSAEKSLRLANTFYQECKNLIQNNFPDLWSEELTFNGAGSPTIKLHQAETSPLNDISAGSCLVKPTTFDIPTLEDYVPACYIATPVLKALKNTSLPAMGGMQKVFNLLDSSNQQSYFIYGGYWKADYYYPAGIKQNALLEVRPIKPC